jgi:hypothetical protein
MEALAFIARAISSSDSFDEIKPCRLIATRYGKLTANNLAFITRAAIHTWYALMKRLLEPFRQNRCQ